jgi:hypothetical protein
MGGGVVCENQVLAGMGEETFGNHGLDTYNVIYIQCRHLPFYLFPGYPDYNDPELANVFKAALPHVVELLAAFTAQLWLIPTQALLLRTTTVDLGNCSQQSQGSN